MLRSPLLISVAHLPKIQETLEERLSGGPVLEPPPSPSLDDYVRSICQLTQPTSALDTAPVRDSSGRRHRPSQACGKSRPATSLQDITARFSSLQPPLPGPGSADPLDWLFGESQEKQPSTKGPLWRTGPSADSWGLCRQTLARPGGAPRGGSVRPGHLSTLWQDHHGRGPQALHGSRPSPTEPAPAAPSGL